MKKYKNIYTYNHIMIRFTVRYIRSDKKASFENLEYKIHKNTTHLV